MTKNEVRVTLEQIDSEGFDYAVSNWPPKRDAKFEGRLQAYEAAAEALASYIKAEAARHGVEDPHEA